MSSTDIARVDPADLGAPLGGGKEFFSQLSGRKQTYWLTMPRRDRIGRLAAYVIPRP